MSAESNLEALLAKGRSRAFDDALASLLHAYHADIEAAQLERPPSLTSQLVATTCRTETKTDKGVPSGAQIDNALENSGQLDVEAKKAVETGRDDARQEHAEAGDPSNSAAVVAQWRSRLAHKQYLANLVEDTFSTCTLKTMVESVYFEATSAVILLFFCMFSAIEIQKQGLYLGHELGWPNYGEPADTGWPVVGDALDMLINVCGALFALEVLFRLVASRIGFFLDWWNYFDILILLSWGIEIVGSRSFGGIQLMRCLRLLRLLRFIQLFRFVSRLDALYFLMQAMRGSLRILVWCILLLFAVQTLTAFLISTLLHAYYFHETSHPLDERQKVFEYFGSFSRALLTTFEMALGNWPVPARVLFENVSEWFLILFLAHKMTVGLSVVGVINAVFVQETMQLATSDDVAMVLRKRKQAAVMKEKLNRLFCAADGNSDGIVSWREFQLVLEHDDVRMWLASMDFDCKDPQNLFHLLDHDQDGHLSAVEFFDGMTSLRGQARAMDLLQVIDEVHILREKLGCDEEADGPIRRVGVLPTPFTGSRSLGVSSAALNTAVISSRPAPC